LPATKAKASPEEIFPNVSLTFVSHSAIGAFGPSFVWYSLPNDTTVGYTTSSAPRCALANIIHFASRFVLLKVLKIFKSLQTRNVVAIHLRRGDSAMARECKTCVAPDEPDVKSDDRIMKISLLHKLNSINSTLGVDDGIFVCSDTDEALDLIHRTMIGRRIVSQTLTRRLHSTQIHSIDDARSLAIDFVSMVLADRIFCLGDSSLSHNAASLSGKACE
jgi:hypothetical protein